jgi:4-hydroxy-4-methyl-2-oxoglutarate aldolase
MKQLAQREMMEKLLKYSTPMVSNVVATYPKNPHCLRLYDPWMGKWYTDQSVRCIFPEMGRRIGYAFTMVVSVPDPKHLDLPSLSFLDLIEDLGRAKKPIIVVCQQEYPDGILEKAGLFGGQSSALFKVCGVIGVVTNGPSRDVDEMRPLGIQYIMSGLTVGHGDFALRAFNIPVSVAGMEVSPGDMIHMDEHGAVKFPEGQLEKICHQIDEFAKEEEVQANALHSAKTIEEIKEAWAKRV